MEKGGSEAVTGPIRRDYFGCRKRRDLDTAARRINDRPRRAALVHERPAVRKNPVEHLRSGAEGREDVHLLVIRKDHISQLGRRPQV